MHHTTGDALKLLHDRHYAGRPDREERLQAAFADDDIARLIRTSREAAGLTQHELARRAGTSQAAIARAENAESEGHSLALLRRIAAVLGKRVVVAMADEPARALAPGGPEVEDAWAAA